MLNENASISMIEIEAYSLPSSSFVPDDAHVFVIDVSRSIEWRNKGGGWTDSRPRTKVASTRAYKEWVLDFIPPNNLEKSGIIFGLNGVCQTYANLELLIAENEASVKSAAKNYVCVWCFGKYGLGLENLKNLLKKSYNEVIKTHTDPYNALPKILSRVDNYLDDEFDAWCKVAKEYCGIDIDSIFSRLPGGREAAKSRLSAFIIERERLYQQYKEDQREFRNKLKELILMGSTESLSYLSRVGVITESEKNTYLRNINEFLSRFFMKLEEQVNSVRENGFITE